MKPWLGSSAVGTPGILRDEPLLDRLFGHPHAAADVGPRCARSTRLVDEMTDEVVGDVTEVLGGEHGIGELFEFVGVHVLDRLDQVVEADLAGRSEWLVSSSPSGMRQVCT